MSAGVRAVVWIGEGTWEATVDAAAALLPSDAEIELLHVAFDAETFVRAGRRGLLGRHPHRVGRSGSADPVSTASEEEAAGAAGRRRRASRPRRDPDRAAGARAGRGARRGTRTPTCSSSPAAASRTTWDPRASGTPSASSSTTRRARSYSSAASAAASASRSWMPSLR